MPPGLVDRMNSFLVLDMNLNLLLEADCQFPIGARVDSTVTLTSALEVLTKDMRPAQYNVSLSWVGSMKISSSETASLGTESVWADAMPSKGAENMLFSNRIITAWNPKLTSFFILDLPVFIQHEVTRIIV